MFSQQEIDILFSLEVFDDFIALTKEFGARNAELGIKECFDARFDGLSYDERLKKARSLTEMFSDGQKWGAEYLRGKTIG